MSDVSKTNEDLLAEARGAFKATNASASLIARLADALEAATRVPVQGEHGISCDYCGDALPMVESRAHIPTTPDIQRLGFDAEKVVCPECVSRARAVQGEPNDELIEYAVDYIENGTMRPERRKALQALAARAAVPDAATDRLRQISNTLADKLNKALTERDDATAAVERVRAIHWPEEIGGASALCGADNLPWPCPTLAAFDGAPEPEPENGEYQAGCGSWDCRAPECGKA